MSQVDPEFELREIVLSNSSFGPNEVGRLASTISKDYSQFQVLRDAVGELESREDRSPATAVRLGVCYNLLGRFRTAAETLAAADGGAVAQFHLGKCHFALENYGQALQAYASAKVAGYNGDDCALAISEALRYKGDREGAMKALDDLFGPIEQTAEYLYQRGATVASVGGNPAEVVALYERAVESGVKHPGALFGLALENDRRGNDMVALDLYQRAAGCFPSHLGALLNLGLMYEDQQRYERAQMCYQRILDVFPAHDRARLFFRDTVASRDMFYDEEAQKRQDRLAQVLNIPVTDFELSVRSRNCLQKMGIRTLGDLTRTSEQDLLTSKNFGETSLVEIRDMLNSRGLELGQFAHERAEPEPAMDTSNLSPDEAALLDRPIADLNLSVRARKCMVRLGLSSINELMRKTGDDLLECKNFGVTSLNEVRDKLTQIGLKLRGD
ncbi:MAG: RNA polymerase subunit alpha domain protein [Planctomycetaceae bacterium]|nr:RNA polymerase subunit alpha domain protein [Planctomycetaceae bacterium]